MTISTSELHGSLLAALGPSGLLAPEEAEHLLVDERGTFSGHAVAVARPASTEQVAAVVRLCAEHDLAVVAQGGNTGQSGGSVPVAGRPSVLVSLTRMAAVEEVNAERFTITTQAGVTIQRLQEEARAVGRRFAPDWGARGTATIGGAVATNAGGINVLRYGPIRSHVLGIEAVLPDGQVWDGLRALRKDVSGYDLKHLFIGSEGTLGIVTRAVVGTVAAAPYELTVFAALHHLDALMDLYSLSREVADDALTAFELVPDLGVRLVCERVPSARHPLAGSSDWYVLIRLVATAPVEELVTDLLATASERGLIVDAAVASSAAQESNLWLIRDELIPTRVFALHEHGFKVDSAVPIDQMADYYRSVEAIAARTTPDALVYAFGHVGDGNLHLTVQPTDPTHLPAWQRALPDLVSRIDDLTFNHGGTISAEHGIGQDLLERVRAQKSPVELELMWRVKHALDPAGRFNPGKVLPAYDWD